MNKIEVCFWEIGMCRQLLASERADDFAARLLSLYILMRTDDITKMWGHTLERGSEARRVADEVLNRYNKVREARDRLGAHYQSPAEDGSVDIFGSGQLFRQYDINEIDALVTELFTARDLIAGGETAPYEFESVHDLDLALQALDELYADDSAYLTNTPLELFGINRGGMISGSDAQRKGQYLRGIELMIEYVYRLYNQPYETKEVKDMFKRHLVALIFSYHDNLFTRTDINEKSPQYQIGFDRLYPSLKSEKRDDVKLLDGVFDRFEEETGVKAYFKGNRIVRDRACAHFDEDSTMEEIGERLDGLNVAEIHGRYEQMLAFFNELCQNTFLLQMLRLPARSPLYKRQFEIPDDVRNFYGKKPQPPTRKEWTAEALLRSLMKQDKDRDCAMELIQERLMSLNERVFSEMITEIAQRLEKIGDFNQELCDIVTCIFRAKRGCPERLQTAILQILALDSTLLSLSNAVCLSLMWALSEIALKSKDYDIFNILGGWVSVDCYPQRCFGILGYLHALIKERDVDKAIKGVARKVDDRFAELCNNFGKPTESLGIWLALCNHWQMDEDYAYYRTYETEYDTFLKNGLMESLGAYMKYIRMNDAKERDEWQRLASAGHYITLLEQLAKKERERKQKPNVFLALFGCGCFVNLPGVAMEAEAMTALRDMCLNNTEA